MDVIASEIREDYVIKRYNGDSYRSGDCDWYEPFTNNIGKLFRSLCKEFGRCISKMYRDYNGQHLMCGWVFEKRHQYSDTKEWYKVETWIEVKWQAV